MALCKEAAERNVKIRILTPRDDGRQIADLIDLMKTGEPMPIFIPRRNNNWMRKPLSFADNSQ